MVSAPGFISYDVKMDKAFLDGVNRAIEAVADLRPVWKSIAVDFYRSEKAVFSLRSAGGYPDFKGPKVAETWKTPGRPDARTRDGSKTAAQNFKIKHYGFDYPLLKATGDLAESLLSPTGRGAVLRMEKQSLEIGSTIPYLGYHQSDDARNKIPLRKPLFIGPESGSVSNKDLQGRLPRWLNMLNSFVLRSLGVTAENARGPING